MTPKKRSKRWNTKITYAENIITYILETPFYAGKFWVKWWLGLAARIFMGAHPQVPSLMWKPGDPWMLTYPYRLFLHNPIMIPHKRITPSSFGGHMSHIPINFHGRCNPPLLLFQDLEPRSITLTKKIPIERAIILGQKAVLLSLETPFSYSNPHIQWWFKPC